MPEQQLFSPDSATVAAWVADLEALANQVDSLSARAKTELGPEAERLGRLNPLSLTYQFASATRQWAERLRMQYLE
ncbi:MAG TPA: hypothetical protein VK988_09840 [Acidimicrobiales bacterium]|nr:hypothetical protein [Acidimicrobiales bacterium]